MGCICHNEIKNSNDYIVYICETKLTTDKNIYEIVTIDSEVLQKTQNLTFIEQCQKITTNPILKDFFCSKINSNSTLFYIFKNKRLINLAFEDAKKFCPFEETFIKLLVINAENIIHNEKITKENIINYISEFENNPLLTAKLNITKLNEKLKYSQNEKLSCTSLKLNEEYYDYELKEQNENNELSITRKINQNTINKIKQKLFFGKTPEKIKNKNLNNIETNENNNNENSEIKKLNIFETDLSEFNYVSSLFDILQQFSYFQIFYFNDNENVNENVWNKICGFIKDNYSLRIIDINGNDLNDQLIETLSISLINKRIRVLNIANNNLTNNGIKELSKFLKNNKTLQNIDCSGNSKLNFGIESVDYIMTSLENHPNILCINLSFMDLTGCGKYIKTFLTTNLSIKNIILRDTKLNSKDFKLIFEGVGLSESLNKIDVSLNKLGGEGSIDFIASGIIKNNKLTGIKLDNIGINMNNYSKLFDAFTNSSSLVDYSLSYNSELKPKMVLSFFLNLTHLKSLEYIPFDSKNDEDKGKELTLEEKKIIEGFKKRSDIKFIWK